ncbi:uncharacterized protein LOC125535524 [Triticum urartu]|uniref:uncharacterized protein LOC125535524 n=1 Tax=Triticum urartu TaxID=4572 RepID=UPI0020439F89|nr:uncharacterized protein LOC125535524 [Triticum urartu]XP_048554546.1 uncharacterized protein LOC125535524 [Triticum urartu]
MQSGNSWLLSFSCTAKMEGTRAGIKKQTKAGAMSTSQLLLYFLLTTSAEQASKALEMNKLQNPVLVLTSSSANRGPQAAAHEKGISGRQHEQGRSSKLRRSSRRGSSLRSRIAKGLEDELEGARGPGAAGARGPGARGSWPAAAHALRGRRGYRRRRSWAAEEHVLCGDGASRAAQVLGSGGASRAARVLGRGGARPVRQRSK